MSGSTESLSDQLVKKEELNGDFFHDKFTSADAAASTLWEPEDMENSHSLIEGDPEDCFFVMSNNDILPATTLRRNVSRSSSQPTMDHGEDVTSGQQQQQRRQSTTNVAAEEHSILSEENSANKTPRRNKDEKLADNSIVETGDDSFLASSFHLQLDSNIELPMNDSDDAFDPPRQRSRSLARSTSSSSKPQARAKSLKRRTGEAERTTKDRSSAPTPLSNRRGRSIGRSSNQNSTSEQEAKHENEGRVSTTKTKVSTKMEMSSSEHHTAPLHRRSRSTGRVSEEAKCIAADSSENSLQRHSLSVKKRSQSAARPRGHGARRGSDNGASGSKRNDVNSSDIKTDDSVETEKRSRSTALTSSRGRSRSVRRTSGGENRDESVKEVTSPPTRRSRSVHQSSTDVGTRSHSVKQRSTARETPDTTGSSSSSDQSSPQYRRSRSAARPSTRDSIQTSRRVTAPENDAGSSGKEAESSLQKSRRSRSTARVSSRDRSRSVKRTAVKEDLVPPASRLSRGSSNGLSNDNNSFQQSSDRFKSGLRRPSLCASQYENEVANMSPPHSPVSAGHTFTCTADERTQRTTHTALREEQSTQPPRLSKSTSLECASEHSPLHRRNVSSGRSSTRVLTKVVKRRPSDDQLAAMGIDASSLHASTLHGSTGGDRRKIVAIRRVKKTKSVDNVIAAEVRPAERSSLRKSSCLAGRSRSIGRRSSADGDGKGSQVQEDVEPEGLADETSFH